MSLQVIAPVRCPHCRSRLTVSKWLVGLGPGARWCTQCRCSVAYDDRADGWYLLGAIRE